MNERTGFTYDEAVAFLAEHSELLGRSVTEIEHDPDLKVARKVLITRLIERLKPVIGAKLDMAAARLEWSIWDRFDSDPPQELWDRLQGLQERRVPERAAEADKKAQELRPRASELENDEEAKAAELLLIFLTVRDVSEEPA